MTIPLADRSSDTAGAAKAPNRGFWALRDIPTLIWLILLALAVLFHRSLPVATWLMLHLLLLGAVTHAIRVWSQHFSYALLRSAPTVADRRRQSRRLGLVNGGAALVVAGVVAAILPITLLGAASLIAGVIWHGASLYARSRRSLPGRFGHTIRYYMAAAAMLPIGATIGAWLAHDNTSGSLVLAHALLNMLGWVGLTVAGTVITLWPTILRTRVDDAAAAGGAHALPVLAAGVLVAAIGAAAGLLPVLAAGLLGYAVGLGIIAISLWRAARSKPPRSYAAMSVGISLVWWAGCLVALVVNAVISLVTGTGMAGMERAVDATVPFLAAGFAAQVLLGALSYLLPVAIGGGPTPVRAGTTGFDRGAALRIAVANSALVVCALPVSSLMRVAASALYFLAMVAFLPIMLTAMRAQSRAKRNGDTLTEHRRGPITPEGEQPPGRRAGQAVAGLIAVMAVVAVTAAIDPVSLGWGSSTTTDSDAPVQVVAVSAADMRFTPNVIEVASGTHLEIELTNTDDSQVHDLALSNGAISERLSPGESTTLDAGVLTSDLDGWCTIIGHRQMGMTLTVVVTDASDAATPDDDMAGMPGMDGMDDGAATDPGAEPGAGFEPYDAALQPLPETDGPTTHEVTLTVTDETIEVAPGVTQLLWTYNGSAPGPVLHGRVGDTFVVTLVNDATMGHSIDFHAGSLAPDEPMRTIQPGESLTYTFTADRAGIWMYHCATMPMSAHIANGMYGAVIIEPDGLAPVDRSYVLVQGEYYLGEDGAEVDTDTLATGNPDLVTFNGYANQYDHAPLAASVGERVRIWVLDAGPNRPTSFHVIGGQFDTVWAEGAYLLDHSEDTGSQALALQPAQGGFVELTFPEAGSYPFTSHIMIDGERGAHGLIEVTDP